MNDTITLYYYTAWDGFAWQGCDEATAKSLQGYMEATKTLPRSSADEPPFGGAVPCKIAGRTGVAVYRYLVRRKGDLSGRDSLYIALAFIPLDVGCVDFVALLGLPQLSGPQSGALRPEEISVSELNLRLADVVEAPGHWLDRDFAVETYRVLRGRDGLRKLSALFFSKYTQLGFLNAVFQSENGIDDLVSSQTYRVYPEVANVVVASKVLQEARKAGGGILDRNHAAVQGMNEALKQLEGWCERQRGYAGLRDYHEEKKQELIDDGEKIRRVCRYTEELRRVLDTLPAINGTLRKGLDVTCEYQVRDCANLARKIVELPVLDHESYKEALMVSVEAMCSSAKLMGAQEGNCRAGAAEKDLQKANDGFETYKRRAETKSSNDQARIKGLERQVESLSLELAKTKGKLQEVGGRCDFRNELIQDPARTDKWSWLPFGGLDLILAIAVVVIFSCVAIMLVKKVFFKNGDGEEVHCAKTSWLFGGAEMAVVSNAVQVQVKDGDAPIMERRTSDDVDRVRLDKFKRMDRPDGGRDPESVKAANPDGKRVKMDEGDVK